MNVLITGHSRGLGAALARHYLEAGGTVYGLSRGTAAFESANLHEARCDLAAHETIMPAFAAVLPASAALDLVYLNAGVLGPIAHMASLPLATLRAVMDVNTWANKIILDGLAARTPRPRQVVLVSSGAAVRGNPGWGAYALSKAALNMLAQLYAGEMPDSHLTALAPGLVDSAMQAELRAVDPGRFPSVARLQQAHGTPDMPDPATAAARIAAIVPLLVERPSGSFVDLRTL